MDTTDNPRPDESGVTAPEAEATQPSRRGAARVIAPVIAALAVGGGVVYVVDHNTGSTASAGNGGTAFSGLPGAGGGGGGGPVAGEQHIQGTVGATTGTSVTVKSTGGTATYTVNATTEIVRNGRTASLSAIQVGDPVVVHVYPSSGQLLVERLLAGSSAAGNEPGRANPPISGGAIIQGGSVTA